MRPVWEAIGVFVKDAYAWLYFEAQHRWQVVGSWQSAGSHGRC